MERIEAAEGGRANGFVTDEDGTEPFDDDEEAVTTGPNVSIVGVGGRAGTSASPRRRGGGGGLVMTRLEVVADLSSVGRTGPPFVLVLVGAGIECVSSEEDEADRVKRFPELEDATDPRDCDEGAICWDDVGGSGGGGGDWIGPNASSSAGRFDMDRLESRREVERIAEIDPAVLASVLPLDRELIVFE